MTVLSGDVEWIISVLIRHRWIERTELTNDAVAISLSRHVQRSFSLFVQLVNHRLVVRFHDDIHHVTD